MATAGSINAVLTLNATEFNKGLDTSLEAVTKFKNNLTRKLDFETVGKNIENLHTHLGNLISRFNELDGQIGSLKNIDKLSQVISRISQSLVKLSDDTLNAEKGINIINAIFEQWQNTLNGVQVQVTNVTRVIKQMASAEEDVIRVTKQYEIGMTNVIRIMKQYEVGQTNVQQSIRNSSNVFKGLYMDFNRVEAEAIRARESLNLYRSEMQQLVYSAKAYNTVDEQINKMRQEREEYARHREEIKKVIASDEELARKKQELAQRMNPVREKLDETTNAMKRQESASKSLSKGFSMLRNAVTLVGSMLAYNFIHKLGQATTETINAKSEMNGYFQMLGYGQRQVDDFNSALDETIKKFPRLNKYALGETISSIGVEFELSTKEMKKAMPVVSMITSEYLRAGRNVNEASLAVKDILQGEFQRLSRETGVKGEQLKEAGWSGDKSDVMGLLEALDKVGKDRNWDKFVAKANSLNDAVLIVQNRFSEWSADMVERVQPMIVGVFNELMEVAGFFAGKLNTVIDFISGNSIAQGIGWATLGASILGVAGALVHLRTGANLTQIAQMGLRNSIIATIFQLDAQTVAEHGLIDTILLKNETITAETLKEYGRLDSIVAVVTGLEAQEVAEIGRTKALAGAILGVDMATLKEEGLAVALLETTTQMEAQEIASMGLAGKIALLGASFVVPTAIVGGFAIALGSVALQMYNSAKQMTKFNKLVNQGDEIVGEARDTVKYYSDKQAELKKKLDETKEGSIEYYRIQQELTGVTNDLSTANANLTNSYKAYQESVSAQQHYNDALTEMNITHQNELAEAYRNAGYSATESYEMANSTLIEARDGAEQLRQALQKIKKVQEKGEQNVNYLLSVYTENGVDLNNPETKKHLADAVDLNQQMQDSLEKALTDESFFGRIDGWLGYYSAQVQSWMNNIGATVQSGDWGAIFENVWKGIAHGFADLPIFKDFWGWVYDQLGVENYRGQGWDAFGNIGKDIFKAIFDPSNFLDNEYDPIADWVNWTLQTDVFGIIGDWIDTFSANVMDAIHNATSYDYLGEFLKTWNLDNFDLGAWVNDTIINPLSDWITQSLTNLSASKSVNGADILRGVIDMGSDAISQLAQSIVDLFKDGLTNAIMNIPVVGNIAQFLGLGQDAETDANAQGQNVAQSYSTGIQTGFEGLDQVINTALSGLGLDEITSQFTTNSATISSTASTTATDVSGKYNTMKTNQSTALSNMVSQNTTAFNSIKNTASTNLNSMRDSTSQVTTQMTNAWTVMKDSIIQSAQKIKTESENRFNGLTTTIKNFYQKIQNPSQWGGGSAGSPSSRTINPSPRSRAVGRSVFGGFAGGNSWNGQSTMSVASLKRKLCPNGDCGDLFYGLNGTDIVDVATFLSLVGGEHGFGGWNFAQSNNKFIKDKSDKWKTGSPVINLLGGIGTSTHFQVGEFNNGQPKISWDAFKSMAQAIFSAIPYRFYYDSSWKGSWLGALQAGACNCYDGALALIAFANACGFRGDMVHGTWTDPDGTQYPHVWATINGMKMDTTAWQQRGSWSAGSPTVRSGSSVRPPSNNNQGDINITVNINEPVYGVDDLDSKISDSIDKGLAKHFNKNYAVGI